MYIQHSIYSYLGMIFKLKYFFSLVFPKYTNNLFPVLEKKQTCKYMNN